MTSYLFTIGDADQLHVKGRGNFISVASDVPRDEVEQQPREGDRIELRGDERVVRTRIRHVPFVSPWTPERPLHVILYDDVSIEQVQVGMTVWRVEG